MGGKSIDKVIMEDFHGYLPSKEDTWKQLLLIPDDKTKLYCIIGYVYGRRVEELCRYEVLPYLKRQKRDEKDPEEVKKWKISNPFYEELKKKGGKTYLPSISVSSFKQGTSKKGSDVLYLTSRNLKNKKLKYKQSPAIVQKDEKILDYLITWIKKQPKEDVDKELFPVNRRTIDRWIKHYAPFFRSSHFLRHLRCTHMAHLSTLRAFAGWTDDRPKAVYVHWNTEDVVKEMEEL